MPKPIQLIAAALLLLSSHAQAALISVNASADMSSGLPLALELLPLGTRVESNVRFDIGPGRIRAAAISAVSGSFSWLDNNNDLQVFEANAASVTTVNSAGWFLLRFTGLGPTLAGITADFFSIQFDIGVNPFTPPGSSAELADLVLNASIDRLRVGAEMGPTQTGELEANVSGTIAEVPAPGLLGLFLTGLFGLLLSKGRRIRVHRDFTVSGD